MRPPTASRTYGWRRSTILSALINAVFLLATMGGIAWESVHLLFAPPAVGGGTVLWVALLGIAVNAFSAFFFFAGRKGDLNVRGAFLHLASDAVLTAGVALASDGVSQREGGMQGGRGTETETVRRHRTAVVVEDHGEPRAHGRPVRIVHPEVEKRVIRLPEGIGGCGLAAIEEIVREAVGLRAVVGERYQTRVEATDDGIHGTVARHAPPFPLRNGNDLAVDCGDSGRRGAQGETFHKVP